MNNDLFISQLKSSSYLSRILDGKDAILLFISGSRIIDIIDERSDYDLVCLTNGGERIEHDEQYLTYNGIKVHWAYIPILKFIGNENGSLMSCFGEVLFGSLRDEVIIYQNNKYLNLIEYLKQNKAYVGNVGTYGLCNFHNDLIVRILQKEKIEESNYCKFIYHLCYASYYIKNELPDKNFLAKIKRIRWQSVTEEYKQKAVDRIKLLKQQVDSNPIDLKNIIRSFNQNISNLLSER